MGQTIRRWLPLIGGVAMLLVIAATSYAALATKRPITSRVAATSRLKRLVACREGSSALQRRCRAEQASIVARETGTQVRASAADTGQAPAVAPYHTDVDPPSAIQFLSASVGWRIDGEYAAPWLDGMLSAGPNGTTLTWPGGSVSETTDGGKTWKIMKTGPDGFWGVDFISNQVGWAVGASNLVGTADGGQTWSNLGEPASGPLVTVQFVSDTAGYGLTASGGLVQTTDGGETWQQGTESTPLAGLCFSSPETGYATDQSGNVLVTTDAGTTWTLDHPTTVPAGYGAVWTQLACDSQATTEAVRIANPNLPGEAYVVAQTTGAHQPWSTLASNPEGGATLSPTNPGTDGIQTLGGIASSQGRTVLSGLPARGFSPGVAVANGPGSAPTAPAYPDVPVSSNLDALTTPPADYMRVLGVSTVGSDVWEYVLDNAVDGTSPTYDTYVLGSTDGGSTWTSLNDSGPQSQPQYP